MTGISSNAKLGELSGFCDCVAHFANAVCGIVENSSQVCHRLLTLSPLLLPTSKCSFVISFEILAKFSAAFNVHP